MSAKKRLLSGVKPTGMLHVGNYFGAIRQFVELQHDHDTFVFIADYHALTSEKVQQSPEDLRNSILSTTAAYIALGLDPSKITIFKQSDIIEHVELSWVFNCLTTVPYLMRAHAYKDAEARGKNLNVGTFDYPLLMAADILMYDADVVPVGKDQKQHVEYARDTAVKFNNIYGDTFNLPEAVIVEGVETVPGIDGQKMSKSYGNAIGLFVSDEEIKKLAMSITTDSTPAGAPLNPDSDNIFNLHRLFSASMIDDLENRYRSGDMTYKESKEILAENLISFITPFRDKYLDLVNSPETIVEVLESGGAKAKMIAEEKMQDVRGRIGIKIK